MSTLTFMTHVCLSRLLPQTNKKVQINSFKTFLPPAYIISCICWTHPEVYTPLGLEGSLPSYHQSKTSAFGRLQLTFFFHCIVRAADKNQDGGYISDASWCYLFKPFTIVLVL